MIGQPLHLPRAEVHHVDLGIAILRQHEGKPIAIRRERRRTVEALEVGYLLTTPGVDVLDEDARRFCSNET